MSQIDTEKLKESGDDEKSESKKVMEGPVASGEDDGEEAPSLVETKPDDDSKSGLVRDLDDEAPKTFPQILHDILLSPEDNDTVAWLPHGRSFIIYKKKKFASTVLPKFFKATKFTSFTRKLNRWGFTRVTRGPEMGSYYHKLFLRDDQSLCLRMSSHSSSKFQEAHHHLMPSPMGMPGMVPGWPGMMPGMPGMPMMVPTVPNGNMDQQNQFINQQLQHLQWQQFQLQQYQQQQQQHGQQGSGQPSPMHAPHMISAHVGQHHVNLQPSMPSQMHAHGMPPSPGAMQSVHGQTAPSSGTQGESPGKAHEM